MVKNEMESYVRIGGRGSKNFTYPYMGLKNCQNHPYVINEWPLMNLALGCLNFHSFMEDRCLKLNYFLLHSSYRVK